LEEINQGDVFDYDLESPDGPKQDYTYSNTYSQFEEVENYNSPIFILDVNIGSPTKKVIPLEIYDYDDHSHIVE